MPSETNKPEPKRTSFALVLAVTLVALVTVVSIAEHCRRKLIEAGEIADVLIEERDDAYHQTSVLTIERDGLRVEVEECAGIVVRLHGEIDKLKVETDALLLRVAELVGEREEALGKVAELRELIVRLKLDRDNLANALADCKLDRERLEEGFLELRNDYDSLKLTEETLRRELQECQCELSRKPRCPCECPPRVEHKKPEKKRKHHR